MMTVDAGRPVQVRIALASDQPLRRIRGRVSGIAPEVGPALEASLQDIGRAARLGMFANGGPQVIALQAAFVSSDVCNFALRMHAQHVSIVRVLANILQVGLAPAAGDRIEIELFGYEDDDETSTPRPGLLSDTDTIAYCDDYRALPFTVDLNMLSADRDHVIRVYFRGSLGDAEFRESVELCRFWDRLLVAGAYLEDSSGQPPFVMEDLEIYLTAPNVLEHIVLGLRQSEACFYGICAALAQAAPAVSPIRRVEIE